MPPFPLADKWQHLRARIERAPIPEATSVTRDLYLDIAERIVREAMTWLDGAGLIIDPYRHKSDYFATSRLVGALGHLLAAGRCQDLAEACASAYEACLVTLDRPALSPEFNVKEMMYAHGTLKDRLPADRTARWEAAWREHNPRLSYNCVANQLDHNFNVFALAGEFFKIEQGLGGDSALIEDLLAGQRRHFTEHGMYRDPNDPMTYDLVVRMQLDLLVSYGYTGEQLEWVREVCRRGALTSLLLQSVTGQMPFGGRSNQFHFVEAHFACVCESQARFYREAGDLVLAGAFKRAGRRAIAMTAPWVFDMKPFRQLKQGFEPALEHGLDSGGFYSVYGLLMASLCGTAYHLADESIEERITPVELGGYVFDLWPAFHKVFATCAGYHLEIDTRADLQKDATGLGRLHRAGAWPETALSASITATPAYSFAGEHPGRNLAIGPAWVGPDGLEHRLADLSAEIEDVGLKTIEETEERVVFEVRYSGEFGAVREVVERYDLSAYGLHYWAQLEPQPAEAWLLAPVIESDGAAEAIVASSADCLTLEYRGAQYEVRGTGPRLTEDRPAANRNALYRTARIDDCEVRLALTRRE